MQGLTEEHAFPLLLYTYYLAMYVLGVVLGWPTFTALGGGAILMPRPILERELSIVCPVDIFYKLSEKRLSSENFRILPESWIVLSTFFWREELDIFWLLGTLRLKSPLNILMKKNWCSLALKMAFFGNKNLANFCWIGKINKICFWWRV